MPRSKSKKKSSSNFHRSKPSNKHTIANKLRDIYGEGCSKNQSRGPKFFGNLLLMCRSCGIFMYLIIYSFLFEYYLTNKDPIYKRNRMSLVSFTILSLIFNLSYMVIQYIFYKNMLYLCNGWYAFFTVLICDILILTIGNALIGLLVPEEVLEYDKKHKTIIF